MSYNLQDLTGFKRHWLLRSSNIPRRFLGWGSEDIEESFGQFDPQIESWLKQVLKGDVIKQIGGLGKTGVGLLLDGGPGLGKTTHAVTTLMELIRRLPETDNEARDVLAMSPEVYGLNSRPIYYLTFPEFLSRKKAIFEADPDSKRQMFAEMEGFHGRAEDDRLNVRVLVLDDLGKEYGSKYDDSSFDEILRARYDKALPTIITTNVPLENWGKKYGEAMGSFAHEAFRLVRIIGEDLRKK
jgi:DNA replication protein DnaC